MVAVSLAAMSTWTSSADNIPLICNIPKRNNQPAGATNAGVLQNHLTVITLDWEYSIVAPNERVSDIHSFFDRRKGSGVPAYACIIVITP